MIYKGVLGAEIARALEGSTLKDKIWAVADGKCEETIL